MVKKVPGMLREFYRAAMASGGIAVEDYGDDYEMAKVVLYAACRDMSEQWKPHTPSAQVDARNIILVTYPNYTRV